MSSSLNDWKYVQPRINPFGRELVLEAVVRNTAHIPGNIVEFGVANGDSTRVIRRTLTRAERFRIRGRRKKIFACDSFEGLPEKYENADVGTFACTPPQIRGVEIVKGYFQDSLTAELAQRVGKVSFASLDADLYSSTLCALRWLTPCCRPAACCCSTSSSARTSRKSERSTSGPPNHKSRPSSSPSSSATRARGAARSTGARCTRSCCPRRSSRRPSAPVRSVARFVKRKIQK